MSLSSVKINAEDLLKFDIGEFKNFESVWTVRDGSVITGGTGIFYLKIRTNQ